MTGTAIQIHHVVFDAKRQCFRGAVATGDAPGRYVSAPGHRNWTYRQIASALATAGRTRNTSMKGSRHDHS